MIISKSIEKDHLIKHIHLQFDESKNVASYSFGSVYRILH